MRKTKNYNLPLIDPGDAFGPDSINTGMESIDTKFKSIDDLVDKIKAAMGTDTSGNPVAVKVQTGSYVGTGTYGESNPCSLTFEFPPKILALLDDTGKIQRTNHYANQNEEDTPAIGFPFMLTESYQEDALFHSWYRFSGVNIIDYYMHAKKAKNGLEVSYYHGYSSTRQFNLLGTTYHWIAIG